VFRLYYNGRQLIEMLLWLVGLAFQLSLWSLEWSLFFTMHYY
jgi:hypothetical protein